MTINRNSFGNRNNNPIGSVTGIVIGLAVLVVLFFLARFIFTILYYLSPIFLIATLIIDRFVILNFLKWIRDLYRKDLIMGIGATVLSIFGFPILSTFLLGKALFKRQVREAAKKAKEYQEGRLIEYEEVEDEFLDLRRLEDQTRKASKSKPDSDQAYEDLFE